MSLSLYIYIYISSFDLILAHPTCISSVLLSLTSFRFSYVANYVLPVFEHNLAYSTRLYISPNLPIACLSSFLFLHFIIFLFFSLNHFFFLFFFLSVFVYLVYLSTCVLFVIFDPTAAAYSSRETNIMIQRLQFYNIFVRCGKYQCLIIIYIIEIYINYWILILIAFILIFILEIILETLLDR